MPPTAKYDAHTIPQKRFDELFGNSKLLKKQVTDYATKEKVSMGGEGGDAGFWETLGKVYDNPVFQFILKVVRPF